MAVAIAVVLAVGSVAAGLAAARGGAPKPIVVRAGNLVLALNGNVEPKALPMDEFAPLGFWGSARLSTIDGSHPPALEESVFDVDKDVAVSVKGLPSCRIEQLEARETSKAKAACGDAIVGHGTATVEVAFPEQTPFDSTGPLIFFNGGEKHGVVTVLAYAYVSVPAPTAVVATAEISPVSKGAFALRVKTAFPRIAGGAGSVVAARFSLRRVYVYRGRQRSVITGRCRDGRLQARGVFTFSDETVLSGSVFRNCTARS